MSLTPMMQHYMRVKEAHKDALLFYRLGDFYELFFEDAVTISQVLHLTLTRRGSHEGHPIPMAGIPHHCADQYIARLIKQGYTVALCDQVTDARSGPVEREVTRIITPGTLTDDSFLPADQSSLLGCLVSGQGKHPPSLAIVELSSGRFSVYEGEWSVLVDECTRQSIKELLIHEDMDASLYASLQEMDCIIRKRPHWEFHLDTQRRALNKHFSLQSLDAFGIEESPHAIIACGVVLHYLQHTQKRALHHIQKISYESCEHALLMDSVTCAHLELIKAQSQTQEHSLLHLFAPSYTPMGLRLIARWMLKPSTHHPLILQRQEALAYLNATPELHAQLSADLSSVGDLERMVSRVGMGSAKPSDLLRLADALSLIPNIKRALHGSHGLLLRLAEKFHIMDEACAHIYATLVQPAPSHMRDGGYIKPSSDPILEECFRLRYDSDQILKSIETREREATGLNLSILRHRMQGLCISIPRSQSDRAPAHYKRLQTLKNEERFSIPDLADLEAKIARAEERMLERERECYQALLSDLSALMPSLNENAQLFALLDALMTMARLGAHPRYTQPMLVAEPCIDIRQGRHPTLERQLEHVVANDTCMHAKERMMLITGPNMGGKSTYMRQVALLCILAYMGSYVPADAMTLGPLDRIMTRIGARDEISRGRSTFMVEMIETAYILNHATAHSLVLMDEVGRGTSTRDGLAIARACAEYLLEVNRSFTLFATHYFELTQCTSLASALNYHVAVYESDQSITFLHRMVSGSTDQSYGVHVAQLAGIPQNVVTQAQHYALLQSTTPAKHETSGGWVSQLRALNIEDITPKAAHLILSHLIESAKSED